ncbi:MAG: hypothetical protein PW788_06540 [Micavibrio sp.]|nr:hypothetical protein [Micavibrio sp.]
MKSFKNLLVAAAVAGVSFASCAQAQETTTITTRESVTAPTVITTTTTAPGAESMKKVVKTTIIRDTDYPVLKEYVTTHRVYCADGFTPMHGECMVPTKQITFYQTGTVLPPDVTYAPLPATIVTQIAAPPPGAVYVTADDNVYLITERDKAILDALNVSALQ